MGIQLKGPFSGFSGKTDGLVGTMKKVRNIITSVPTPSSKAPTKKQTDQRFKFGLITHLLSYISDLIDIGFGEHKVSGSAMNAAVVYHLKYTVTGISPDFGINLPQLSFSRSKLIGPKSVTAEALAGANAVSRSALTYTIRLPVDFTRDKSAYVSGFYRYRGKSER